MQRQLKRRKHGLRKASDQEAQVAGTKERKGGGRKTRAKKGRGRKSSDDGLGEDFFRGRKSSEDAGPEPSGGDDPSKVLRGPLCTLKGP